MWFWILLIVSVVFYYSYKKSNSSDEKTKADREETLSENKYQKTSSTAFENEVMQHATTVFNEITLAAEQYELNLKNTYENDIEIKKRLSKLAEDAKLDLSLTNLWQDLEELFSEYKTFDGHEKKELQIIDWHITKNEEKQKEIGFLWNKINFTIKYKESTFLIDSNDNYRAYISLYENDEEVFAVSADIKTNEYTNITEYIGLRIDTFKRQGEWYKFLLKSYHILKSKELSESIDHRYYGAEKIKDNFKE